MSARNITFSTFAALAVACLACATPGPGHYVPPDAAREHGLTDLRDSLQLGNPIGRVVAAADSEWISTQRPTGIPDEPEKQSTGAGYDGYTVAHIGLRRLQGERYWRVCSWAAGRCRGVRGLASVGRLCGTRTAALGRLTVASLAASVSSNCR